MKEGHGLDLGVSLRCAPGRASRAVGNDTTVANGAEPPARQGPHPTRRIGAGAPVSRPCGRESLTHRGTGRMIAAVEVRSPATHLPGVPARPVLAFLAALAVASVSTSACAQPAPAALADPCPFAAHAP